MFVFVCIFDPGFQTSWPLPEHRRIPLKRGAANALAKNQKLFTANKRKKRECLVCAPSAHLYITLTNCF